MAMPVEDARVKAVLQTLIHSAERDVEAHKSLERRHLVKCFSIIAGIPLALGLTGAAVASVTFGALPAAAVGVALAVAALALGVIYVRTHLGRFPEFQRAAFVVDESLGATQCQQLAGALIQHPSELDVRSELVAAANTYSARGRALASGSAKREVDEKNLAVARCSLRISRQGLQSRLNSILEDCRKELREALPEVLAAKLREICSFIENKPANLEDGAFATQLNELAQQLFSLQGARHPVVIDRITSDCGDFHKVVGLIPSLERRVAELEAKLSTYSPRHTN